MVQPEGTFPLTDTGIMQACLHFGKENSFVEGFVDFQPYFTVYSTSSLTLILLAGSMQCLGTPSYLLALSQASNEEHLRVSTASATNVDERNQTSGLGWGSYNGIVLSPDFISPKNAPHCGLQQRALQRLPHLSESCLREVPSNILQGF
jgi:hypothetical protein